MRPFRIGSASVFFAPAPRLEARTFAFFQAAHAARPKARSSSSHSRNGFVRFASIHSSVRAPVIRTSGTSQCLLDELGVGFTKPVDAHAVEDGPFDGPVLAIELVELVNLELTKK